jgi:holliday junction DNA helicase RuvA
VLDSIEGRLVAREPTRAVVEAGGLGYAIRIPLSTYEDLPAPDRTVRLLLHVVVRDGEWRLFGFRTTEERDVFRALLKVSGVGPVIALGLLSGLEPLELRDAVARGDVKALSRVKGIGRKTAERIVVDLRDVLGEPVAPGESALAGPGGTGPRADAVRALLALGLDVAEAARRVDAALARGVGENLGDLVRAALRS